MDPNNATPNTTTVINNVPGENNQGGGFGLGMFFVLLMALAAVFYYFILPKMEASAPQKQPSSVDVNVNVGGTAE